MSRALNFMSASAALLAGCVFISTENAQHSADLAAAAAASCPAAAGAAETARQAAAEAEQAAQDFQTHQNQASALREQAQLALAEAETYRNLARQAEIEKARLDRQRAESSEHAAEIAISCRSRAAEFRQDEDDPFWLPDPMVEGDMFDSVEGYGCDCDSSASCDAAAEHYDDEAAFLATSVRLLAEAQAAIDENLAAAERAEARARELERDAVLESAQAARAERAVEDAEGRAAEAAARAQEIAFENCGAGATFAVPGPDGTYNQDIYGSQNRGLGSCPVGSPMQASCLAIQFMCNASCGPPGAPTSCSPGAPAGCLACYAAGCI